MNTVAEFHELILQDECAFAKVESERIVKKNVGCEFDEEAPSLVLSCSSLSLDDSLCSFRSIQSACSATACNPKSRSIRFNEHVEVTEYSLSVGDHPMCADGLPVQLGWSHAAPTWRHIDSSKCRGLVYEGAPRLSLLERRRRLQAVGETEDDRNCTPPSMPSVLSSSSLLAMVDFIQNSLAITIAPSDSTETYDGGDDNTVPLEDVPTEVVIQV